MLGGSTRQQLDDGDGLRNGQHLERTEGGSL